MAYVETVLINGSGHRCQESKETVLGSLMESSTVGCPRSAYLVDARHIFDADR